MPESSERFEKNIRPEAIIDISGLGVEIKNGVVTITDDRRTLFYSQLGLKEGSLVILSQGLEKGAEQNSGEIIEIDPKSQSLKVKILD